MHTEEEEPDGIAEGLTRESTSEQASAGLDQLTSDEFAQFRDLNAAYDEKLGFPFLIDLRPAGGKTGVLNAMR